MAEDTATSPNAQAIDWANVNRVARLLAAKTLLAVGCDAEAYELRGIAPIRGRATALELLHLALVRVCDKTTPRAAQEVFDAVLYVASAIYMGRADMIGRYLAEVRRVARRYGAA